MKNLTDRKLLIDISSFLRSAEDGIHTGLEQTEEE